MEVSVDFVVVGAPEFAKHDQVNTALCRSIVMLSSLGPLSCPGIFISYRFDWQ